MDETKYEKHLITLLVFSIAITGLVFADTKKAHADVIGENECFPAVLLIRGSGETPIIDNVYYKNDDTSNPLMQTNGHEGQKLHQLLLYFTKKTDPAKTTSKTRFIGVDYPALDVFPTDVLSNTESKDDNIRLNSTIC